MNGQIDNNGKEAKNYSLLAKAFWTALTVAGLIFGYNVINFDQTQRVVVATQRTVINTLDNHTMDLQRIRQDLIEIKAEAERIKRDADEIKIRAADIKRDLERLAPTQGPK